MVNGRKIRELREAENLTANEFAAKVGASQPFITQIENGYREPSVKLLKRIADYFDIKTDDLLSKDSA